MQVSESARAYASAFSSDEEQVRNLLASIVESSEDAIVAKTLDGTIRSWNRSAERLFGYTQEEAVGQHISLIIPADRIQEESLIIARLTKGERIEHFETIRRRKDGSEIELSITISPIHDSTGTIVGASKVARDISERRRTEMILKEEARRKDEFLAVLAHELRNPLAPVRNVVELLNLKPNKTPDEEWGFGILDRQVTQMTRLIDDLLDVARINRNTLELRLEQIDLLDAIRLAIDTSDPLLSHSGHTLIKTFSDEPIRMKGDLVRLAQITSNLLNNAAKYTPGGGRIEIAVSRERNKAIIRVSDSGIGIAKDKLPDIFDMFRQVQTGIKNPQGGLGIGLALAKNLTELHGGTLSVESEEGIGSTFTVTLPIKQAGAAAHAGSGAQEDGEESLEGLRVVIIDDNIDAAESLALLLKSHHCTVKVGYDGFDAYQLTSSFGPHVLLLDIGMPKVNGLEASQMIRRQEWGKDIVIIATTGWGQESDKHDSRVAGLDHHFVKPIDFGALHSLLKTIREKQLPSS